MTITAAALAAFLSHDPAALLSDMFPDDTWTAAVLFDHTRDPETGSRAIDAHWCAEGTTPQGRLYSVQTWDPWIGQRIACAGYVCTVPGSRPGDCPEWQLVAIDSACR